MENLLTNFQSYVDDLIKTHNVPALSIAVWHENTLYQAASGILNIETGIAATTDSIFQIGSITKVFTASLVMQLVSSGQVELDKSVKHYLRDFQVADPDATATITVRQLLSHTSGLESDLYPDDTKQSGNLIARYLDRCNLLPQVYQPGRGFSYSNAGYAILGRLVEVVLGVPYFTVVEERIYKPLGMGHAVAHPMNTLRYRAAMGHFPKPGYPKQWQLAPVCYGCMGLAPAGRLTTSAADLITFAKVHLNEGQAASGEQWLSVDAVAAMQQLQVALPPYSASQVTNWGLGWSLINSEDHNQQKQAPIIGHGGQTFGQSAVLRILPQQNSAFAALTNVGGGDVLKQVVDDLLLELANVKFKAPETLTKLKTPERFTGQFESLGYRYKIALENQQLVARIKDKVLSTPAAISYLKPIGDNTFASYAAGGQFKSTLAFLNIDAQGVPQSLFSDYRLINRI